MSDVTDCINETDKYQILDMIGILIENNISDNALSFSNPEFHKTLYHTVYEQATILVKNAFTYDVSDELEQFIKEALQTYFIYICPKRSYRTTSIKNPPNVEIMKDKISYLSNIPQPAQRTEEWYAFRHNYLTASSIWKAFSTEGSRNQLIYSKCLPLDTSKYSKINLDSPLHWGQKYEEVSLEWYKHTYKTKVSDFGCIPHSDIPYVAASPDGINTDETSHRYGRMVEVKNIVNREITGIPKEEYWIQMQIQLDVCNLNECDFLETRFTEYEDIEEFKQDGNSFTHTPDGKQKGIMSLFFNTDGHPVYEYAPLNITEELFAMWNVDMMQKHAKDTWLKHVYWKLDEVSVVLVVKNKRWLNVAKPILKDIWDVITKERKDGYDHRAPRKRARNIPQQEVAVQKCLIDISV